VTGDFFLLNFVALELLYTVKRKFTLVHSKKFTIQKSTNAFSYTVKSKKKKELVHGGTQEQLAVSWQTLLQAAVDKVIRKPSPHRDR
jgi:hypothetical protein